MSQSEKKKIAGSQTESLSPRSDKENGSGRKYQGKTIRRVHPLGMRVLVEIQKDEDVSEGGLYLPEGAKESLQESVLARVLEVASALDHHTDEEANISGIPMGATVLIPKKAGTRIPWDDNLRIVETKEILSIVNEIQIV